MLTKYKSIDFDSDESYEYSHRVLHDKKVLYDNYCDMYHWMKRLADTYTSSTGMELELGSGGGFFKELYPEIVTSDVTMVNGVDMKIDARDLPFDNETLRCIYGVHVMHHIPDIELFFREASRSLKTGGGDRDGGTILESDSKAFL